MKQKVIITGITGLIGRRLAKHLISHGYEVIGLSRNPDIETDLKHHGVKMASWGGDGDTGWYDELNSSYALINLAGENIASGRWSRTRREAILHSRLESVQRCRRGIDAVSEKPELFFQGSAIGYYGLSAGEVGEGGTSGTGFLADVCRQVESSAIQIQSTRVVCLRTGIVLSAVGGALPEMMAPMRWGIAGYPGSGKQYVSWIHIDDLADAILFLLTNSGSRPIYNLTSPSAVTMKHLVVALAGKRGAPVILPVPAGVLAIINGWQMVRETLLASQQIIPESLLADGFVFRYPEVEKALADLLLPG